MITIPYVISLLLAFEITGSPAIFEESCALGDCEAPEGSAMLQSRSGNRGKKLGLVSFIWRMLYREQQPDRNSSTAQQIFEHIYEENIWNSPESFSGTGSELGSTTNLRKCLRNWIEKYNVTIVMDIPCGDANWQSHIPLEDVEYYGYDISPRALKLAQEKNKNIPNMHFDILDLATTDPPGTADILIIKEVIQHVPIKMGLEMFRHAKASGIKLLATTTAANWDNKDVEIGGWYMGPDVLKPPFNFPKEAEVCVTYNDNEKMRLFNLQDWDGSR